jgi:hypothetical protein
MRGGDGPRAFWHNPVVKLIASSDTRALDGIAQMMIER